MERVIRKRKNKKKKIIGIGILFIFIGIVLIGIDIVPDLIKNEKEDNALKEFYNNQENLENDKINVKNEVVNIKENREKDVERINYISVIKISKIGLEKGIVSKDSKYNDIKYGIELLEESNLPDEENGNVILAAHSGNSNISYFKDLDKLINGDEIELTYGGKKYIYKVTKIYDVDKIGEVTIERDNNNSALTLITCRDKTNYQIVIIAELVNII